MEKAFSLFDSDAHLNIIEFTGIVSGIGNSKNQGRIGEAFRKSDLDSNSVLVFSEFLLALQRLTISNCDFIIDRFFNIYDTNHDGLIHLHEFRKAFEILENDVSSEEYEEADDNFRSVDENSDNIVTCKEYIDALH